MHLQIKYKEEIIKELENVPAENLPKLLEMVHYLKKCIRKSKKKVKTKKDRDPLYDLGSIAVKTGIKDLAENHDYYLYGVQK